MKWKLLLPLFVIAISVGFWLSGLRGRGTPSVSAGHGSSGAEAAQGASGSTAPHASPDAKRKLSPPRVVYTDEQGNVVSSTDPSVEVPEDPPEEMTPAEKAVEVWDKLIERFSEPRSTPPTVAERQRFYEAFNQLDKDDQQENISHAVNLIPDENITVLYDILYDHTQNEDVLDTIFSDILNRDEEIKIPVMKELAKDNLHPSRIEARRILDVIRSDDE